MDKSALFERHRHALQQRLADLKAASGSARSGTRVDGTHRPSNRGERAAVTSQGYLAHGLGLRAAEVEEALRQLSLVDEGPRTRVSVGAVVTVELEDGTVRRLAVLPGGDGARVDQVEVVSLRSPLVAPLVGLEEGDGAEVVRAGHSLDVEIIEVR
ncbi:MAG: GreA/GreB family elongation factor [Myxococcota bacterium]